MLQFMNNIYLGNKVSTYLMFLLILAVGLPIVRLTGTLLLNKLSVWAKKTETTIYERLSKSVEKRLMPAVYIIIFYLATKTLTLHPTITKIISTVVIAFAMLMGAIVISSISVLIFEKYWEKRKSESQNKLAPNLIIGVIRTVIWVVALVMLLENIGIEINSLIAGLGIGGLAIAFAAQAVISDIFCFFTIVFDQPFEIGDYIIAGEQNGTIEHIGIKTTRVRALSGEQLVFANSDLTSTRIRNYKTMQQRRVLITLSVTYDTDVEKLREIPKIIEQIVFDVEDATFARAHFSAYGPFSLDFEIVYYVLSGEYEKYMNVNQEINLCIKAEFEKCGIQFAFPTQTLHISQGK
jgi:small-conductance mechanosensitive channel